MGSLSWLVLKKNYSLPVGGNYAFKVMSIYSVSQSIWQISRKFIYLGLPMLIAKCMILNSLGNYQKKNIVQVLFC